MSKGVGLWLVILLSGAVEATAAPPSSSPGAAFGRQQFEEVLTVLARKYIEPKLAAPHIWSSAANGAVSALHSNIELLPSGFLALKKFSETRFSGKNEPFVCMGRKIPGVVIHHVPRRKKDQKPYGQGGDSTGEPLVDAALAWPPPFGRKDFDCVVDWVLKRIVSKSDAIRADDVVERGTAVKRGTRIKLLSDEDAARRRAEMWLTATRWMLRALDPHSKLTTVQKWRELNAPIDAVTKEDDVTVSVLDRKKGLLRVRLRKFAPGGDARVRAGIEVARRTLAKQQLRGIVLDMRGNGGGILPVAVGLVESFMRGGFVARVKTRDAIAGVPLSRRKREIIEVPLIVLVNERCASACEFTSAALQDGLRALVVGERTYGKATLQEYTGLKTTNMRVMITVAMFFSPTGHPIQATGITPDLRVTARADDKPIPRGREEDVPFHLRAETLANFRDVHFFKPHVVRCVRSVITASKSVHDFQLARAEVALRCLADVEDAFANGTLQPIAVKWPELKR